MPDTSTGVVVIGGGSTGAGVLRDLALRGIDAILVEKGDLASGTTGRSHGLLHSGGRYCVNDEQAADLSRALGDKIAVQMRGHGSVVVGESAEAAFFGCTFLEENACKQLEAEIMGGAVALSADEARDCSESTYNPRLFNLLWSYYESKVVLPSD